MNRNPIIPYILIMVMGLALVFFLAVKGVGDSKEVAEGKDGKKEEAVEKFEPEAFAEKTCVSCHGENLKGGAGPSLHGTGLSKDKVADILQNGLPGGMPGGLVPAENLDEMAEYISKLK